MVLVMSRCGKVQPRPPQATGFDPPIAPALSYLAGPLHFPLSELQAKINQGLDPVLIGRSSKESRGNPLLPLRVVRSGPVRIRYENQTVSFSAPIQVFLVSPFRSGGPDSLKDPFCALHVDFQSPLAVSPDWRLSTRTRFQQYRWIRRPVVKILGREISLTELAQRELERRKPDIEAAIDSAVYNELRLDQIVKPIWESLQKPLMLSKAYGLWLLPMPVGVTTGPLQGDNRQLTIPLRIAFQTRTVLNRKPPEPTPLPLPVLEKRDSVDLTSDLRIMSFLSYADINRILAESFQREKLELGLGALTIQGATIYGGQHSIIARTQVKGLVNGTLYFRGRPQFDTTTSTLKVIGVGFDAQTEEALPDRIAQWWGKPLCRLLEEFLVFPLGEEIRRIPETITSELKKGEAGRAADFAIRDFQLVPQRVAVRPDGIQTLIQIRSKVDVSIRQL